MTFRQRLAIIGVLAAAGVALYGLGRYYSPVLITYVVEQTLAEKAPPGTDKQLLQSRFRSLVSSSGSREIRLQRLFRLSQYLEKVQELTRPELEILLREAPNGSSTGPLKKSLEPFPTSQCLTYQG